MALLVNGSTHLIPALLLIYRPRKDERLSWLSWLTCSGWLTHISGHQSAAGRAQDRESSPVRDRRSTTVLRHQPKTPAGQDKFQWSQDPDKDQDRPEVVLRRLETKIKTRKLYNTGCNRYTDQPTSGSQQLQHSEAARDRN